MKWTCLAVSEAIYHMYKEVWEAAIAKCWSVKGSQPKKYATDRYELAVTKAATTCTCIIGHLPKKALEGMFPVFTKRRLDTLYSART